MERKGSKSPHTFYPRQAFTSTLVSQEVLPTWSKIS